jgi:hypothetical protein
MATANVERLHAALDQAPDDAADLIVAALRARGGAKVIEALTDDPRFVPWIVQAVRDERIRAEIPYLSRTCAKLGLREIEPDLVAIWREDGGASATNAGWAILELGEPESLAVLAADAPNRLGAERTICFRAAFALRPPTEAFDRFRAHLGHDDLVQSLFTFLANNHELADADPRWQLATSDALRARAPEIARAARRLLLALAGEETVRRAESRRDVSAASPRAAVTEADAAAARSRVQKALAHLADSGFALRHPVEPAVLDELESLVGPLPPAVRALYETCDGLRVEGDPPHEVYAISTALDAARRWVRAERPGGAASDLVRPFELPVAPDAYTLRGLSGGPDLAVVYPWEAADPAVRHAPRTPRFSTLVVRAVKSAT